MKTHLVFILIIISVGLFVSISYGSDYFPLQIGNVWYFGGSDPGYFSLTDTIISVDTTTGYNGLMYTGYVHPLGSDSSSISFYEWNGSIYRFGRGIWCKKDLQVGDWWYDLRDSTIHTVVAEESLSVPAGNFLSMKVFWEPNIDNDGEFDWFVDGVGLGKYMYWLVSDTSISVLDSAVVNGIHYPTITSISSDNRRSIFNDFRLTQNYPNPFNPETTIEYSVQQSSHVDLKIYNALGQIVRTLVDDHKTTGEYSVIWDGKDNSGKAVPSGNYFYQIEMGDFTSTKKMIYIK